MGRYRQSHLLYNAKIFCLLLVDRNETRLAIIESSIEENNIYWIAKYNFLEMLTQFLFNVKFGFITFWVT